MSDIFDSRSIVTALVVGLGFALALVLERLVPLRPTRESKLRHVVRNLTTGGVALAVMTLLQAPLLVPISQWVMERSIGLLNWITLPHTARVIVGIVLLDYTLWFWHWASHRIPFLWRFHLVHHVDLDLDASTALRFHFGELVLSIFYRALQIIILGVEPFTVWLWQTILFASILFHHGNFRLPLKLERWLVHLIVTPRMHGIHHSNFENETNSNWSSLISLWDRLHGTLLLNVPQEIVEIGIPAYSQPEDVAIGNVLRLPFVRQRDDWKRDDGASSERDHVGDATRLG